MLHHQVENNQINLLFCFVFIIIGIFTICQPFPVVRPRTYQDFIATCETYIWVCFKNLNIQLSGSITLDQASQARRVSSRGHIPRRHFKIEGNVLLCDAKDVDEA